MTSPSDANPWPRGRRVGTRRRQPFAFGKAPATVAEKSLNQAGRHRFERAVSVPGNAAAPGVETSFRPCPGHAPRSGRVMR